MTSVYRRAHPIPLSPIVKLAAHDTGRFDCGKEELNQFLKKHALPTQRSDGGTTYVACRDTVVVGYYTLVTGCVDHKDAPPRIGKGLPSHRRVGVMILARLAVDLTEQGCGLGTGLLKNGLRRTVEAADIAGVRALLIHAKDEEARQWYQQFDIEESPTDPLHLFLLMKDIRAIIR